MKNLTMQKKDAINIAKNHSSSKMRTYFAAFLLLIISFGFIPKQTNASIVGTDATTPTIVVFADVTWTVLSTNTLTLSGFTVTGATSVTWNSADLQYYAIVKTSTGGANRRLVTVDPLTGVCTDIGPMGAQFSTLTFSPSGTLYAMAGQGAGVAFAQKLYSVSTVTGTPTFLAGPFPLGADGEVLAYNYDDTFIYHWSGNSTANMEKINSTTFVATPIIQSGVTHTEIFGAVYQGGGRFVLTDLANRALTSTSGGVVALQASALPFDVRGLGYVDPLLPVEMSSFTSTIIGRDVTLNWVTATETNNSGFVVERSIVNGEWSAVGNVSGNGTSNVSHHYSFTDRGLASGKYNYRLRQIDYNGNFEYFNLSNEVNIGVPAKFELSQNYPNPFNPTTNINYDLPFDGKVNVTLFDFTGREVATLVNEVKPAGYYTLSFNAFNLSSGVYFYKISANANGQNFVSTKKMMLIK